MSPHTLTPQGVRQHVQPGIAGFYRLGTIVNGEFFTYYFGRSDEDLRQRLLRHASNGFYTHFTAREAEDVQDAFEMECLDWHLQGDQTTNKVHPAQPKGSDLECPYCSYNEQITEINTANNGIYTNVR
ncbi:hypothetical protein NP511_04665 [Natrinema thermotolerans]|uniref:GIY-YIG domain-containing protein n=1 Tax=Natrinema thermotolerans TaxID=121872 RepID=A0AAF0SZZ3_9EURY|nr:hypothetical protein [Natrinema thermotolerans]QCC57835.1 hypothetical protein DVR14_03935 [Natrinema thermotolerans]WMT08926.1 hypothetical protein NP511_04665 [Natrinema thermotolerans]